DHPVRTKRGATTVYFELDLASNVRRLRATGGADLGGYRFSAFGSELEDTASGMFVQAFRWKGRPRDVLGASLETYDMRAREWVPEAAVFVAVDEYAFHARETTLWGWPGQSAIRFRDPYGRGFCDRFPWFPGCPQKPAPPPSPPDAGPNCSHCQKEYEADRDRCFQTWGHPPGAPPAQCDAGPRDPVEKGRDGCLADARARRDACLCNCDKLKCPRVAQR
ncbi:MAG: hypothetical protein KC492_01980, partial [Myxococcales bacterium]|nr:hypothetical protein [Myxococcales bacterium]